MSSLKTSSVSRIASVGFHSVYMYLLLKNIVHSLVHYA